MNENVQNNYRNSWKKQQFYFQKHGIFLHQFQIVSSGPPKGQMVTISFKPVNLPPEIFRGRLSSKSPYEVWSLTTIIIFFVILILLNILELARQWTTLFIWPLKTTFRGRVLISYKAEAAKEHASVYIFSSHHGVREIRWQFLIGLGTIIFAFLGVEVLIGYYFLVFRVLIYNVQTHDREAKICYKKSNINAKYRIVKIPHEVCNHDQWQTEIQKYRG